MSGGAAYATLGGRLYGVRSSISARVLASGSRKKAIHISPPAGRVELRDEGHAQRLAIELDAAVQIAVVQADLPDR
jgi:hypothetical protein